MKKLDSIPKIGFERHSEAGTLGDSEHINEEDLKQFDNQLKPYGLQLAVFENGAALNWFITTLKQ